jgi:hypothetical protein
MFLRGSKKLIARCKEDMVVEFKMKDVGMMRPFLGLEVWQRPREIFLGQGKYVVEMLKRFWMEDCKPMATPMITNLKKVTTSDSDMVDPMLYRQLIGSLMYMVNTRTDICFAVNTLSEFMVELRQEHWVATQHVLRYLRGTMEYGLRYLGDGEMKLQGYTDSNWASSAADRKSTLGCCFSLGSAMISQFSKKQTSMALSSAEAEYMAASTASCEAIW